MPQPTRFLDRSTPPHLSTLILIAGMSALSMNIFLPSLPGMAAWFDVPYSTMQQSVPLYLALSAVLQIFIGPLADRYGRRLVLQVSLSVFLLASIGTLLAPTAEIFLVCRMLQAVVAACMVMSRAIVRDISSDAQAASMMGYVTMGMSLVPMIGPVIGGWLDAAWGWQANFAFLLGVGAVVTALVWADLGETSTPRDIPLLAQMGEYRHLLTAPRFWGYCMVMAFSSGCFFAFLGGAPYVGNQIYGLESDEIGYCFLFVAGGYGFGSFLAGRYSVRIGMNPMILIGTGIATLGLVVLAALVWVGITGPIVFFGLMLPLGIGNGICMPNANAGLLSVRPHLAGSASGLGGAIMIGGGAGLASLAGMLLGPGATEMPLVLLMLVSSIASMVAIQYVRHRARAIGLPG